MGGGSFNLDSMHMTSAWDNNCLVVLTGIKIDGSQVTTTITLTSMTDPELYEFEQFDDLQYFKLETPHDGDITVIDDMVLTITNPCFVPDMSTLSRNKILDKLEDRRTIDSLLAWP